MLQVRISLQVNSYNCFKRRYDHGYMNFNNIILLLYTSLHGWLFLLRLAIRFCYIKKLKRNNCKCQCFIEPKEVIDFFLIDLKTEQLQNKF